MDNLAHKVKIFALWMFYIVLFLTVLVLGLFGPGGIQMVMSGEIGGVNLTSEYLTGAAVSLLIPVVMAFLALSLKDSINRWANAIVGAFTTGAPPYAILPEIAKTVVPVLIVWYAYRWPKEETQSLKTPAQKQTIRV
ncbi:MAG: hypothetical protein JRN52_13705 [Nitrososphaerota archaeon]|nr:hypothetical protein [Nitrososphaerota archaeon]